MNTSGAQEVDPPIIPPNRPPDESSVIRVLPSGEIETQYFGPRSTGEDGSPSVAALVVAALNAEGEEWGDPRPPMGPEQGVDSEAKGPSGMLRLQITRLPHTESFWKDLTTTGTATRVAGIGRVAEEIIEAIRAKAVRTPPDQRAGITLILDATRFFDFEMETMLREYYARFGIEAIAFGFEDILLVGTMQLRGLASPESVPNGGTAV